MFAGGCLFPCLECESATNTCLFHIHITVGCHLDGVKGIRHQLLLSLLFHTHEAVLGRVRYDAKLDLVRLFGFCVKVAKPNFLSS